jgi:hypothetical protein
MRKNNRGSRGRRISTLQLKDFCNREYKPGDFVFCSRYYYNEKVEAFIGEVVSIKDTTISVNRIDNQKRVVIRKPGQQLIISKEMARGAIHTD